jgi:hypothetical protein
MAYLLKNASILNWYTPKSYHHEDITGEKSKSNVQLGLDHQYDYQEEPQLFDALKPKTP